MQRISLWAAARPYRALGSWAALFAVLTVLGHGVERHLQAFDVSVGGSSSANAAQLTAAHFADSATLPVLLEGPSRKVRSQAKALASRLAEVPGVTVSSPWNDPGHRSILRPRADQVLLLASVSGSAREQQSRAQDVRDTARAGVSGPVTQHVTGVPLVAQDLRAASLDAISKADLIALPLLLLALLLVFRSFAAAAIPAVFGTATVLASGGAVRLLSELTPVDGFATALASMMGLALAVDYSLLTIARFRELRHRQVPMDRAIATASRSAAHVLTVAGGAVVLSMVLAATFAAGQAAAPAVLGVAAAAVLAMAGAVLALPAALVLAGDRLVSRGADRGDATRRRQFAGAVHARPALAAVVVGGVLLVVALPSLSQSPSAPDVTQLPASSAARADFQAISRAVGPGWAAGFDIVSVAPEGTMTTGPRLAALARLQRQIARDPAVDVVLGPGQIAKTAAALRRSGRRLVSAQKQLTAAAPKQQGKIRRLGRQVGSASSGTRRLSAAFDTAAQSADRLAAGGDNLKTGVGRLSSGLKSATSGAGRLDRSVASATANSGSIAATVAQSRRDADDLAQALSLLGRGSSQLPPAIRELQAHDQAARDAIRQATTDAAAQRSAAVTQINTARAALAYQRQTVGTVAAVAALEKAKSALESDPTSRLSAIADTLNADADTAGTMAGAVSTVRFHELAAKARSLVAILKSADEHQGALKKGIATLTTSIAELRTALQRLGGGTDALSGGLAKLDAGITSLRGGAQEGKSQTDSLARGLEGAQTALAQAGPPRGGAGRTSQTDAATTRHAIDSGYYVLAALDAQGRTGAATGLDVDRGGQAARILVIPRYGPNDARTRALGHRLAQMTQGFAGSTRTATAVGGPAQVLADYQRATSGRLLTIVLVLALATGLLLAVVLRSVLVAVVGVGLGLLATGATLGLMDRLFTGADPLLGGPGQLDGTALTAVFAVMFALATDYQVFVVSRIREEVLSGAANPVLTGVTSTARVVTGAALSMVAVFVAFGTADVASLKQFGFGLAIAVALDATLIRMVMLPALLALCGRWAWWPGVRAAPEAASLARVHQLQGQPV